MVFAGPDPAPTRIVFRPTDTRTRPAKSTLTDPKFCNDCEYAIKIVWTTRNHELVRAALVQSVIKTVDSGALTKRTVKLRVQVGGGGGGG